MSNEEIYLFDIYLQIWKVFKKRVFTYMYEAERNAVM